MNDLFQILSRIFWTQSGGVSCRYGTGAQKKKLLIVARLPSRCPVSIFRVFIIHWMTEQKASMLDDELRPLLKRFHLLSLLKEPIAIATLSSMSYTGTRSPELRNKGQVSNYHFHTERVHTYTPDVPWSRIWKSIPPIVCNIIVYHRLMSCGVYIAWIRMHCKSKMKWSFRYKNLVKEADGTKEDSAAS
jgi:hypothetical protein